MLARGQHRGSVLHDRRLLSARETRKPPGTRTTSRFTFHEATSRRSRLLEAQPWVAGLGTECDVTRPGPSIPQISHPTHLLSTTVVQSFLGATTITASHHRDERTLQYTPSGILTYTASHNTQPCISITSSQLDRLGPFRLMSNRVVGHPPGAAGGNVEDQSTAVPLPWLLRRDC